MEEGGGVGSEVGQRDQPVVGHFVTTKQVEVGERSKAGQRVQPVARHFITTF
jgi:hypothetical protein